MSATLNTAGGSFRLMVPSTGEVSPGQPTIEILGCRWVLTDETAIPERVDAPVFTCVSYAWGTGRTAHPFDDSELMSDRTIGVLETVVRVHQPEALWIDAFCVPFDESDRAACLSKLGAIYSRASRLVVVLSEQCSEALSQVQRADKVESAALLRFEGDDWVSRVWTYQELVNCSTVHFVAEGGSGDSVKAEDILNKIGHAISDYKKENGLDTFQMCELHPRLDCLENLIVDWKISEYLERSAYQVISGMYKRVSAQPEDRFFAMLGAIDATPDQELTSPTQHPAETFMQLCEAKGDYSFIYCAAPRSSTPGKRWRPTPEDHYEAVFPWHSYGSGQAGCVHSTHVQLSEMWCVAPGSITDSAKQSVERWLRNSSTKSSDLPADILALLRLAGFSGCGEYLETENGYFFVHACPEQRGDVFVAVATGVEMTLGSPGLLLNTSDSEIDRCCGVGMFVGQVPKSGESINVS